MSEKKIIKLSQNIACFSNIANEHDTAKLEIAPSVQPTQLALKAQYSDFKDETLGLYIGFCDTIDIIETALPSTYNEFMIIIDGRVEIKNNKTGDIETIMSGESFVIPQGVNCQWRQQGYLRKFYVIYEPQEILANPVTEQVVFIDENSDISWKETSSGQRKKILYRSNNQRFTVGVWQSNALTTNLIDFPYHEFIFIHKGSLICIDDTGGSHYFKRGDALFIPQGTRCAWQVKDKVSIHFAQLNTVKTV